MFAWVCLLSSCDGCLLFAAGWGVCFQGDCCGLLVSCGCIVLVLLIVLFIGRRV